MSDEPDYIDNYLDHIDSIDFYVMRPRGVKAAQISVGNIYVVKDWIQQHGDRAEVVSRGAICDNVYDLQVSGPNVSMRIPYGDWVVLYPTGMFVHVTAEEWPELFEEKQPEIVAASEDEDE